MRRAAQELCHLRLALVARRKQHAKRAQLGGGWRHITTTVLMRIASQRQSQAQHQLMLHS